MGRNTREIELFNEKLILFERTAGDVLSFAEFVNTNTDNKDIGSILYQSALIVEAGLFNNRKNAPVFRGNILFNKFLKFIGLGKKYKEYLSLVEDVEKFNSKLKATYVLNNLSQKEIFEIVKIVYELEGLKLEDENTPEKKS